MILCSNKLYRVNDPDTTWKKEVYQQNYIGGKTEANSYHFYPVNHLVATQRSYARRIIVSATVKKYYVLVDKEIFSLNDEKFVGITNKMDWTFTTKKEKPDVNARSFTVSADGSADFNTVQAGIDHIPENNKERKTIFIKNGVYDEISCTLEINAT